MLIEQLKFYIEVLMHLGVLIFIAFCIITLVVMGTIIACEAVRAFLRKR